MKLTQVNDTRGDELVMAVGLETAGGSWKLALQDGRRGKPALHTCKEQQAQARLEAAVQRIEQTKGKWGLPTGTRVVGFADGDAGGDRVRGGEGRCLVCR